MTRGWWTASAVKTVGLAVALLAGVLVSSELAARSGLVRRQFPAPSVGTPSRMLDLQLAKLATLVDAEGPVDCLFLGNSLALFGIDPEAFAAAFEARSGRRLRCFNFAVPGIAASGIAAIAGIVARDYRPGLIIYGVTPRDFNDGADAPAVETTPWVRYRYGAATIDGWLAEHSHAYRYFLMVAGGHLRDPGPIRQFAAAAPRGFFESARVWPFDDTAVGRAKELAVRQMSATTSDAQMHALDGVLALHAAGIQVVLVELPLHLPLAQWPPEAAAAYRRVMERVERRADDAGVPFWAPPTDLLPGDSWIDVWHLNARGAAIFSRWLGDRAARAVETGELRAPARSFGSPVS